MRKMGETRVRKRDRNDMRIKIKIYKEIGE